MNKKVNKEILADKIADLLTSKPTSFDPEDDSVDDTSAKVLTEGVDDDDDVEEEILSKFRKANVDLLSDVDKKYAGKRASRKSLQESDQESEPSIVSEEEESDDNDSQGEAENEETSEDDEEIEDNEGSMNDEEDEEEEYMQEFETDEKESNFKHMKDVNVSSQVRKGQCVRNQINIWENLLEMRIQLQKCLLAANQMPQADYLNEIKKESGPDFSQKFSETKTNITNLLEKLLKLQTLVIKKYPETKNLEKSEEKSTKIENDDDDEEIPSDTEDEHSDNEEDHEEREIEEKPRKIRKLNDYESELNDQFNLYKNYRNDVIQKWNDKTRIIKVGTASHSVLNQIEHNLNDKDRLRKRTQLKRSQYKILGKDKDLDSDNEGQEHNTEIFDDDDFYHQLLRELIEVKSADLTDPIQLGRQWIQLEKLRSKMKRKVDTRATKGRKIRYTIHAKLVNFMAPMDENLWTDEAKNELYNSLFGKK